MEWFARFPGNHNGEDATNWYLSPPLFVCNSFPFRNSNKTRRRRVPGCLRVLLTLHGQIQSRVPCWRGRGLLFIRSRLVTRWRAISRQKAKNCLPRVYICNVMSSAGWTDVCSHPAKCETGRERYRIAFSSLTWQKVEQHIRERLNKSCGTLNDLFTDLLQVHSIQA